MNLGCTIAMKAAPLALAYLLLLTGCVKMDTSTSKAPLTPELEAGWVTNCTGPAFTKFGIPRPGAERPVFKITNQLVLAVPREHWPDASSIDAEPTQCTNISDVPQAHFVTFYIQGDWSSGYKPEDIPNEPGGSRKMFRPDSVWVRVEPEQPSTLSPDEEKKVAQMVWEYRHLDNEGTFESGGLTCPIPKLQQPYLCYGAGTKTDPDVPIFMYDKYKFTPFVRLKGDYPSSKYGRIHIYWSTWTSDMSHGIDIDKAVWRTLAEWNLLPEAETQTVPRS
jgi:hypothetical protein